MDTLGSLFTTERTAPTQMPAIPLSGPNLSDWVRWDSSLQFEEGSGSRGVGSLWIQLDSRRIPPDRRCGFDTTEDSSSDSEDGAAAAEDAPVPPKAKGPAPKPRAQAAAAPRRAAASSAQTLAFHRLCRQGGGADGPRTPRTAPLTCFAFCVGFASCVSFL